MSIAIESNDELEKLCERLCKMPDGGRVSVGPLEVCAETQDAPTCSGVSCRRPLSSGGAGIQSRSEAVNGGGTLVVCHHRIT